MAEKKKRYRVFIEKEEYILISAEILVSAKNYDEALKKAERRAPLIIQPEACKVEREESRSWYAYKAEELP